MGFGIAGLILALVAIVTTIGFNLVAVWLALACATIAAASRRGAVLASAVWLACAGELLLNAQTLGTLIGVARVADPSMVGVRTTSLYITLAAFAAPILSLLLRHGSTFRGVRPSNNDVAPDGVTASASDALQEEPAAPVRAPTRDGLSATARIFMMLALALGATAVFYFLCAIDNPQPIEQTPSARAQP